MWPWQCCVLDDRCVAMAASEEVSGDPHGSPAPRHSRSSWMVAAWLSSHEMSCRSSSSLPFAGQVSVDMPPRTQAVFSYVPGRRQLLLPYHGVLCWRPWRNCGIMLIS